MVHPTLFDVNPELPPGLVYRPNFITEAEEAALLKVIDGLPLFHPTTQGYEAKRRIIHFGWSFDLDKNILIPGDPLPDFLAPIARKIAKWLAIDKRRVAEALINEYPTGYGLGWHRDRESFEHVVGVSLKSYARMRFRPLRTPKGRKRSAKDALAVPLAPRSAYIMQHASRWEYQHSVAPVEELRYSITFRTLPH